MTRAKVCGLTHPDDVELAVAAGADAVGVVVDVDVETPREVSAGRAAELFAAVPPFVTGVVVTMLDEPTAALDLVARTGADAVQLHADLAPAAVAEVAEETTTLAVVAADEPERARALDGAADALLVDTPSAEGGGGTGRTHDWPATRRLREAVEIPVVLAGGLTPGNVVEAVAAVEPHAVDVASGVERAPGRKDPEAVRAFVRRATRPAEAARR